MGSSQSMEHGQDGPSSDTPYYPHHLTDSLFKSWLQHSSLPGCWQRSWKCSESRGQSNWGCSESRGQSNWECSESRGQSNWECSESRQSNWEYSERRGQSNWKSYCKRSQCFNKSSRKTVQICQE